MALSKSAHQRSSEHYSLNDFHSIQKLKLKPWSSVGSCPRYMICVTFFCTLCESENTRTCENHTCFACNSRMSVCFWLAQRAKTCNKIWYLWPLPNHQNFLLSWVQIAVGAVYPNTGQLAVWWHCLMSRSHLWPISLSPPDKVTLSLPDKDKLLSLWFLYGEWHGKALTCH